MAQLRRNAVFTALSDTIGHELVFKHYTNKVVVAQYPDMRKLKPSKLQTQHRNKMKEANDFAQSVMKNAVLRLVYEKDLKPGESVYHKARMAFFERLKRGKS